MVRIISILLFTLGLLTGCSSPFLPFYQVGALQFETPYMSLTNHSRMSNYIIDSSNGESIHDGFDYFVTRDVQFRAVYSGVVDSVELLQNSAYPDVRQVNVRIQVSDKVAVEYIFEPFATQNVQIDNQSAAINVVAGDAISSGQVIGSLIYCGDTSAHLHFGVSEYGQTVYPGDYFSPSDVSEMLTFFQSSNGSTANLLEYR